MESGIGRYSILEYSAAATKFHDLVEAERFADANRVLQVLECFETWSAKVKGLRRDFERKARGKYGKAWKTTIEMENGEWKDGGSVDSLYKIWKPIEGVPGVLVPG